MFKSPGSRAGHGRGNTTMTILSSSRQLWNYKAKANATSGYPGDGYMLWDNATQTSATHLVFAHRTTDNLDIDLLLTLVTSGSTIILQDSSFNGNFQEWTTTGAGVNTNAGTTTSYWTYPVTLVASGGLGTSGFANNHQLLAIVYGAATGGTVTHTAGALTANDLVVGNGAGDIKVVAATDGQVPIGKSSDGSVNLHTLTAGTNITITNGGGTITIASTATGFDLTPDFLLMGG